MYMHIKHIVLANNNDGTNHRSTFEASELKVIYT